MIKIDYLIERDEGDEIREFVPTDIPTELPDVAYIQGPNSSGKSTLLNLIALAFYGLKLSQDELNSDLRERLENLINSTHQNIRFQIEIDNPKIGIKFVSKKENIYSKDFVVRKIVDGKDSPISADTFQREYKLVYDIPNNPLERLPLLLNTIKEDQKEIKNEISNVRNFLLNIISDIQASRDPELIKTLKDRLTDDIKTLDDETEKLMYLEVKQTNIKKYFYARFLNQYEEEQRETSKKIKEIKKYITKENRARKQEDVATENRLAQLKIVYDQIEEKKKTIKLILPKLIEKDQKVHLKIWADTDIRNELYRPEIYNSLRTKSEYFITYLNDILQTENQNYRIDLDYVKLLKTLIAILLEYEHNDLSMPVVNLPISEFINSLKEDLKKYQTITTKLENIKNCVRSLEQLKNLVNNGINIVKEIIKDKNISSEDFNDLITRQQELEELKTTEEGLLEKIKLLKYSAIRDNQVPDEVIKKYKILREDENLSIYEYYKEEQLKEVLSSIETEINEKKVASQGLVRRIEDNKQNIQRLEQKEPHKYQEKYISITKALEYIQLLEMDFEAFNTKLKKIMVSKTKHSDLSDDEQEYTKLIGEFLAQKIKIIKHISNTYRVSNINIVEENIYTEDGKLIKFKDLGTGQGQAAYLDTLLSMSENKKIIALFDEVAMMDESSLQPIKEKLRRLYEEKKLLMAVIVQKGETIKVESLI